MTISNDCLFVILPGSEVVVMICVVVGIAQSKTGHCAVCITSMIGHCIGASHDKHADRLYILQLELKEKKY